MLERSEASCQGGADLIFAPWSVMASLFIKPVKSRYEKIKKEVYLNE
jgi:hypothetical protein